MIAVAVALAALIAPFHVTAHVTNYTTPKRTVSVNVQTVAGATCSVTDSLTGLVLHGKTSKAGRAAWHWRPSVWANGADTASVTCAKGSFHRSAKVPLALLLLWQISKLRDYALHVVYWAPAGDMPAEVPPEMEQFESDVKASLDAGATDNPFAIPRAYADSLGAADPRIASIDTVVDTDPYPGTPAPGYCAAAATPCLGDPDIAHEVTRLGAQNGWVPGNHTLVMLFTAPSLTVCSRFSTQKCTRQTEPAGYHDLAHAGYAYADIIMSGLSFCGCTPSEYAVAVVAHEQDEAVVDPLANGVEVADPCERDALQSVPINGHSYNLPAIEEPDGNCAFGYTP